MHNSHVIYDQSIKHLLKMPLIYILLGIVLLIGAFIFFVIPAVVNFDGQGFDTYYGTISWVNTAIPVLFCLIPLFSAVIGEANANTAEKIYILSKPVKKGNFLIVKILSTITIALIFLILLISMFVGVTIWLHFKTDSINVFKDHINPYAFFANLIIFSLFGSFLGTLLHYQIKNGITTLIALALSGAFVAVFMMLYPLSTTNSDLEYEHAYWFTSLAPEMIFLPLTVLTTAISWIIFMKSTVES